MLVEISLSFSMVWYERRILHAYMVVTPFLFFFISGSIFEIIFLLMRYD